jgi:hypothetical protein
MLSGLGPVEYGYPKQYSIESGTYCGEIEYISRSAQSDKNQEIDKASRAKASGWGFQEQNISVCRLCTDANKSIKG